MQVWEERFWAKVKKTRKCWIWTAASDGRGYGKINIDRKYRASHRIAWELTNGPIPEGMYVLHSCDNPRCVNPRHLRIGTGKDNSADMIKRKRHPLLRRPTCKWGHRFDESNTYWRPDRPGHRTCRTCNNEASLRHYPKRKLKGRPW